MVIVAAVLSFTVLFFKSFAIFPYNNLLRCIKASHRRTSQGGCSPPDSGKAIIFWAKAKFFGQKPAANGIHFV